MTTQKGKKWKEHAPQAGAGEGTRNREGGERGGKSDLCFLSQAMT